MFWSTSDREPDARPSSPEMAQLVLLQEADGSWPLSRELSAVLGVDLQRLSAAIAGSRGPEEDVLRAWATALALAWLERNAAESRDEWRLLGAKAFAWLQTAAAAPPGDLTWREAALQQLGH